MKFKLPTHSTVTTTTTYPHPTKPGQYYSITYAPAEFPDDTPECAREVWDSWRPMARISAEGFVCIPFEHENFYDLSCTGRPYFMVLAEIWSTVSDAGLDNYIADFSASCAKVNMNSGLFRAQIKLGADTFDESLKILRMGCLKYESVTHNTCVLRTARFVPLEVLTQLPSDTVIVTTLEKVGNHPLIVNGRKQEISYTSTRSGRVLGFVLGSYPVKGVISNASESARLSYGLLALPDAPKVLVAQWRFGDLVDVVQIMHQTPDMVAIFTNDEGDWTTDIDDLADQGFDEFNSYAVPESFTDDEIRRVLGRVAFEN